MLVYKIDVLKELKNAGYSTYRLQKEAILGVSTIQRLREKSTGITLASLSKICDLLDCSPEDIIQRIPEPAPSLPGGEDQSNQEASPM